MGKRAAGSGADGRDWDGWMSIPLYYTGLDSIARVSKEDGVATTYRLDRDHNIRLKVEIPAEGKFC